MPLVLVLFFDVRKLPPYITKINTLFPTQFEKRVSSIALCTRNSSHNIVYLYFRWPFFLLAAIQNEYVGGVALFAITLVAIAKFSA